jgi:hypothetical protein
MNILSATSVLMVGQTGLSFPLPQLLSVNNITALNYVAVINAGGSDAMVSLSANQDPAGAPGGTLIAAPTSTVQPSTLRALTSLEVGPVVSIPLTSGAKYLNAISIATSVTVAITAASAGSGSTTLTVASATGIVAGQGVVAPGVPANTTVVNVSGTTITLSIATTAALNNVETHFTALASPAPPAVLIVALGA